MRVAARIRSLAVVVTMAAAAIGAAPAADLRLEVAGVHGVVWVAPIARGEHFDVAYRHSQERVLWTQHYRAERAGTLWQEGSTFEGYGAGMPLTPVHREAGGFRSGDLRRLRVVPLLSWRGAGLRLVYRGESVSLDRWFDDYAPFDIRVR